MLPGVGKYRNIWAILLAHIINPSGRKQEERQRYKPIIAQCAVFLIAKQFQIKFSQFQVGIMGTQGRV